MARYVQPTFIVDSSATFLRSTAFDSSIYLKGVTHINAPSTVSANNPYALVLESGSGSNLIVKSAQLGTMAFDDTSVWDASLSAIRTDITNLESSVGTLDSIKLNKAGDTMTGLLTLDSTGFALDSVTITNIDTSAEGFGVGSDTAIPTSGLVKSYVDSAIIAGVTASNGLTEVGSDIQLGGDIIKDTILDVSNGYTFQIKNALSQLFKFEAGSSNDSRLQMGIDTNNYLVFERYNSGNRAQWYVGTSSQVILDTGSFTFEDNSNQPILKISDNATNKIEAGQAIRYESDQIANYNSRTLPDWGNVKAYVDGSMANSGFATISYVDGSLATRDTRLDNHDTSISSLNGLIITNISDISDINDYQLIQDASITALENGALSAGSAITFDGTTIDLGGDQTGDVEIYGKDNAFAIYAEDTYSDGLYIGNSGGSSVKIALQATSSSDDTAYLILNDNNDGKITLAFNTDADSKITFDSTGFSYGGNIASRNTSNDRWLVDKGYVDSQISSESTLAWNGLTKTDNSIGLGGTLIADTLINTSSYQFGITGSVNITGDLTVDGSITYLNTNNLDVSDNIIQINSGLTGAPPVGLVSGMRVNRGSSDPYFFIFSEADDTFRIGINASEGGLPGGTQAVATRQDTPTDEGIAFWNNSANRFDTEADFTFNATTGLSIADLITGTGGASLSGGITLNGTAGITITNLSDQGSEATVLALTDATLGTVELGTGAFATIADYATKSYVDTSLGVRDARLTGVETSITDLSTGKLDAIASTTGATGHEVYSTEADNVAYIKRLVAGTGASLVSDSSTVTISVSGAAGYMSKYTGTFDGTAYDSSTVLASAHGLGTGPFIVSVYDNREKVEVGVIYNTSGDITLEWSSGSLSASCSYIISG